MKLSNTTKLFNLITFYIILITLTGMSGTYLSDYLIEINWFGDIDTGKIYVESRKRVIIWGPRHYWYNWGSLVLFICTIIRAIVSCARYYETLEEKSYESEEE
tara:strand:- start:35 stop:343 length:309 start_codon:yes stop_codon:yes gene_type:complete